MQSSVSCSQKTGTGPADPLGKQPGVVEPEQVIGMMMRERNGVHAPIRSRRSWIRISGVVSMSKLPAGNARARWAGPRISAGRSRCRRNNRSPEPARPWTCRFPGRSTVAGELKSLRSTDDASKGAPALGRESNGDILRKPALNGDISGEV